jgi:hypothetical protein
MVKSAERRSDHYEKKLDGDVWNYRFTEQKKMMVEQVNERYTEQAFNETKIKAYLENIGFYGLQQHHYMNYGQELYSLVRKFAGETLRLEAEQKASKWLRRGLDPTHLTQIAKLYGINITV